MLARRRLTLEVAGLEHVPRDGPLLLAARHAHHLYDGVALMSVVPRTLRVMVALDWVRSLPMRWLMETATSMAGWPVVLRTDALTVGPDGDARNVGGAYRREEIQGYQLRATRRALDRLAAGGALVVFPEAYPNVDPGYTPKQALDDRLPFRRGCAALATMARDHRRITVPVVPVGLRYVQDGNRWRVFVRFGAPLVLGAERDAPALLTAALEARVAALSCGSAGADRFLDAAQHHPARPTRAQLLDPSSQHAAMVGTLGCDSVGGA